jgi:dTDP-4-amino-4,6-dideoxygalactose transaminase
MSDKIWLSSPHMEGTEFEFVKEAFDTNWISPVGPHITAFEKELGEYLTIPHVAALSSGTAAIHLALILLNVKAGDEVLCSSFTFSGSVNPVIYQGAVPVFIDSESETWNMDPALLEAAIRERIRAGKKPKAIILVHLYGTPAKLNEIMALAAKHEIPVIEDAAEALGSTYFKQAAGTFGDLGILSFNGNKIITTSGGGALVSKQKNLIDKARFLATQARDPAPHYEHTEIGYNYRLSNVCAGIGRGQLKVLDKRVQQRRNNFEFYKTQLSKLGITFPAEPDNCHSNRWLTTVTIDPTSGVTPEKIRLTLEKENIETRPVWKPMHLQPVFKQFKSYVTGISEGIFRDGLCLPSGSNMTPEQLERVCRAIRSIF